MTKGNVKANEGEKNSPLDALRQSVFSADETMQTARKLAATDPNDPELLFRYRAAQDNHGIARGRFNRAFNQVVQEKRNLREQK